VNPVEIFVDLVPGFEVERIDSPYHAVEIETAEDGFLIGLEGGPRAADRDFELRWRPLPGAAPEAVLFTEEHGASSYALLMVTPAVPAGAPVVPPAREVVYVIDTSGSMAGDSIVQAREALTYGLERLAPEDRFNVIAFDHEPEALFPEARDASRWNVDQALAFTHGLEADGGTNIASAIRLALPEPAAEEEALRAAGGEVLRQVVFLTDGSVGNEDELLVELERRIGESRVFSVGIGSAPNTFFMRKLAELGRGSFTHVGSPMEVAEKMTGLFRKLESVVVSEIELELPSGVAFEMFPPEIPDLYAGEPVVVALALDAPFDWARVRGRTGRDAWAVDLDRRDGEGRPGVHVLWARRAIAARMDERRAVSEPAALDALRDAVVDLARTHHLVTRYTSLVAVDVTELRRGYESLASHRLAVDLPAGWRGGDAFGLAQGATSAGNAVAVGLFLLLLAWLGRLMFRDLW